MKTGDRAKAAPAVTGLDKWVEGTVIDIGEFGSNPPTFFGEKHKKSVST